MTALERRKSPIKLVNWETTETTFRTALMVVFKEAVKSEVGTLKHSEKRNSPEESPPFVVAPPQEISKSRRKKNRGSVSFSFSMVAKMKIKKSWG